MGKGFGNLALFGRKKRANQSQAKAEEQFFHFVF
jgi:hypothetical protein